MPLLEDIDVGSAEPTSSGVSFPREISRIGAEDISYDEFFSRFMQTNTAVIITSVADSWECFQRWVLRDDTEIDKVDVSYLKARIGNVIVPVADCGKQYYNAHEKQEMKFHDFLDYWNTFRDSDNSSLYLKDWHLRSQLPEYKFYQTPMFFASDWLNEFLLDRKRDDYMFVYMGPKGTWTSFHADVFSSYSWSTNISGEKKWLLLPPGEEVKLHDSLVFQTAGEALFVPSGWFHQVHNVQNSISVNHNWFNGTNISRIWLSLDEALDKVVKEIEDCRSMENFDEHCQLMLKASYGMNFSEFLEIISHVCTKRILTYAVQANVVHFDRYRLGRKHVRFDIESIQNVLNLMLARTNLFDRLQLLSKLEECIKSINEIL
ncbi:2-oxoglutarate and iron-dependent oxygenase JMJD4 homolog [Topomyia yanbarensis]|uniref:2-oxoglutarate and iron-dependent oxygenase JMJD4 homolog n=1 Tax=Topomyia yanbarensis TaxID=2498891 RepID=UPI00273C2552|nr:2-oxoglutarate and iron-dependent oxygenase JMJD4 homolog [Topomyia yanbarensis]